MRVAVARNDICKNERGGGGEKHARTREPKAFHGWLRKYKKTSGFNSPAERRTMLVGFNVGFTPINNPTFAARFIAITSATYDARIFSRPFPSVVSRTIFGPQPFVLPFTEGKRISSREFTSIDIIFF